MRFVAKGMRKRTATPLAWLVRALLLRSSLLPALSSFLPPWRLAPWMDAVSPFECDRQCFDAWAAGMRRHNQVQHSFFHPSSSLFVTGPMMYPIFLLPSSIPFVARHPLSDVRVFAVAACSSYRSEAMDGLLIESAVAGVIISASRGSSPGPGHQIISRQSMGRGADRQDRSREPRRRPAASTSAAAWGTRPGRQGPGARDTDQCFDTCPPRTIKQYRHQQ